LNLNEERAGLGKQQQDLPWTKRKASPWLKHNPVAGFSASAHSNQICKRASCAMLA
jgi:hypothetical protein